MKIKKTKCITAEIEKEMQKCVTAAKTALGINAYDEQIQAAYALYSGNVAEMPTGDGKTLAAVFAAHLLAKNGRKIHILTYNDYLAKRDYYWMKPVYDILGDDTGLITSNTPRNDRRKIYGKTIVYTTAKECGFDFLRDFLCFDENDAVLPLLDAAIADEADSILIDEAGIPLAIAGTIETEMCCHIPECTKFVKTLEPGDYKIAEAERDIYLTKSGIKAAEKYFNLNNLYDESNFALLSAVNDSLKAVWFLKENRDYIADEKGVHIIDEFTGRIARGRNYPGTIQSAVELKHGLNISERGVIMGIIPVQFFMREYGTTAGMTGTVGNAAEEFELLYGLKCVKIPPHKPNKRKDNEIEIYYNGETKFNAIIEAILEKHKIGQPVLVGAADIAECEKITEVLREKGVSDAQCLTAKNDEEEAAVIGNAGKFGAVTVSANMAGRGVDIKLGGKNESERDKVIKTGGLCVISTSIRESGRINDQMKGRAGRQGDPGESKTFAAIDDPVMVKNELLKLLPAKHIPKHTENPVSDKIVLREVKRTQRISEGAKLDERKRMLKFTMIGEKHRRAIFRKRREYLTGESKPNFWEKLPDYGDIVKKFGETAIEKAEKETALAVINEIWSVYIEYTSDLRRGIHLTSVGGKNPSEEYNVETEKFYLQLPDLTETLMEEHFGKLRTTNDVSEYKTIKPQSLQTYCLDESGDELIKRPLLSGGADVEPDEEEDGDYDDAEYGEQTDSVKI